MGSWEDWTLTVYDGEELDHLVEAGAPLLAAISNGNQLYPPVPFVPGGRFKRAVTQRWCAVALRAFYSCASGYDQRKGAAAIRAMLADAELRVAFLASLELGGPGAGELLLWAATP